jgi:hypothetical protein
MERGQDMKRLKAPAWQQIWYGLFHAALYSWCVANNFATYLQCFNIYRLEAAATADDVSIVSAFVAHPGMCVCVASLLSLSEPEGLFSG